MLHFLEPTCSVPDTEKKVIKQVMARGGTIGFCRRWLDWEEADTLYKKLANEIPWSKSTIIIRGEPVKTPRLQAWMGDVGVRPDVYSANRVDWTPELLELRGRLEKACFGPDHEGKGFDYVLLNLYQDGSHYISYHADREVRQDEDLIASVSLGAVRRFLVRPLQTDAQKKETQEWTLHNGDLMTMNGLMQRNYKHSVPKTAKKVGPRINLTFRQS